MACILTTAFALDCKDSIGGIKNIWVVESTAKASITVNSSGTATALTLNAGKNFFKYELRKNTSHFDPEIMTNDANGTTFYPGTLTIQMTKMEVYKRNELKLLAQQNLLFIVLDRNGVYWLIGNNNGCTLKTGKGSTGTSMGDFNGWNLDFEYMEEDMPLILNSTVTAALGL